MSKIRIYGKSILFPVVLGGIVGLVLSRCMDYASLQKPFLAPPGFVFPIVWTILYVLMGVSYGRLKTKELTEEKVNFIYYTQLLINALWSIFFFCFQWRLFSFFWLLLLIAFVVWMIIEFFQREKGAGLLQIPYLLWILFAAYLNLSFYLLNK